MAQLVQVLDPNIEFPSLVPNTLQASDLQKLEEMTKASSLTTLPFECDNLDRKLLWAKLATILNGIIHV